VEHGAIDLHKRDTLIRLLTAEGQVTLDRRVPTTREQLTAVFRGRPRARVLVESSTESEWVAQTIEACGHEVVVAAPGYALMYGHRDPHIKTDRRDVAALAEACRLGIYRRAHRVCAAQRARRRALKVRELLVRQRTALINFLRAEVRHEGLRLRSCAAESVVRQYRTLAVPAALADSLALVIAALDDLNDAIAATTAALTATAAADPIVRRLQTAPGIGPITGLTFRAVIDDVGRFDDARGVAAYVGLVPKEDSSGSRQRKGAITKAGPTGLRALLIQASWVVWRQRKSGGALHAWVERLAARRGKRIAVVALARRLARILFAMWRDGNDFRVQPA
jgi:transposase